MNQENVYPLPPYEQPPRDLSRQGTEEIGRSPWRLHLALAGCPEMLTDGDDPGTREKLNR